MSLPLLRLAQVLSALAPAALELSVTAAAQAEAGRIGRQRLERADFACDRARRQHQLAEPENRLGGPPARARVGSRARRAGPPGREYQRYQRQRPARLSAAELAAIRALASDIPALWATAAAGAASGPANRG